MQLRYKHVTEIISELFNKFDASAKKKKKIVVVTNANSVRLRASFWGTISSTLLIASVSKTTIQNCRNCQCWSKLITSKTHESVRHHNFLTLHS